MNAQLQPVIDDIEKSVFDQIVTDCEYCKGCMYLMTVKDAYGTGDSPTLYDCAAVKPKQCFRVRDAMERSDADLPALLRRQAS